MLVKTSEGVTVVDDWKPTIGIRHDGKAAMGTNAERLQKALLGDSQLKLVEQRVKQALGVKPSLLWRIYALFTSTRT